MQKREKDKIKLLLKVLNSLENEYEIYGGSMKATEARSKSNWNMLPNIIREEITKTVMEGGTALYFYKETYPNIFIDVYIIKQALLELGYGVTHEKLSDDGERLIIRW